MGPTATLAALAEASDEAGLAEGDRQRAANRRAGAVYHAPPADDAMTDPTIALLDSPALPSIVARLQRTLHDETERRQMFRDDLDPSVKAEFINGEIIMHSPARARHTDCVGRILRLLSTHVQIRDLGRVAFEKALVGLTRNDYEPDV